MRQVTFASGTYNIPPFSVTISCMGRVSGYKAALDPTFNTRIISQERLTNLGNYIPEVNDGSPLLTTIDMDQTYNNPYCSSDFSLVFEILSRELVAPRRPRMIKIKFDLKEEYPKLSYYFYLANRSKDEPRHLIFRGNAQLEIIKSVGLGQFSNDRSYINYEIFQESAAKTSSSDESSGLIW